MSLPLVAALAVATADAPVTRLEFVTQESAWLDTLETRLHKSLKRPKETILVYVDVPEPFRARAVSLERDYRLYEGVDRFGYGTLDPNRAVTRRQATQLILNLLSLVETLPTEPSAPLDFTDAPRDPFEVARIEVLLQHGILAGFPDKTLQLDAPLSHTQFAALCDRMQHDLAEARP
jgi:hypothetical protein